MKNLLMILCALTLSFTACNKSCDEGGKCKNGGICVAGECDCPFEYTGDNCGQQTRSMYTGAWRLILDNQLTGPDTTNIFITKNLNDVKRMMVGDYIVELTSETDFILPDQNVNSLQTAGSGSFDGDTFAGEITVEIVGIPVGTPMFGERL